MKDVNRERLMNRLFILLNRLLVIVLCSVDAPDRATNVYYTSKNIASDHKSSFIQKSGCNLILLHSSYYSFCNVRGSTKQKHTQGIKRGHTESQTQIKAVAISSS